MTEVGIKTGLPYIIKERKRKIPIIDIICMGQL
jgi:hypothetical protein